MSKTPADAAGFAEQLQELLGNAQQQAKDWLSQRDVVTKTLTTIRDTASQLLSELGAQADAARRRGRPPGTTAKRGPGGPPGSAKKAKKLGRRKGFKMSAEARAKIAAAQKARWAAQRKKG